MSRVNQEAVEKVEKHYAKGGTEINVIGHYSEGALGELSPEATPGVAKTQSLERE